MSAKETAKAIRKELKANFKGVKFSVTSENFSGGDAVRIGWVDGPTYEKVDELVKKYQYGSFNSMEDIYENTNRNADLPQAKFVSCTRDFSLETKRACVGLLEMEFDVEIETEELINRWTKKPELNIITRRIEHSDDDVQVLVRRKAWNKDFYWNLKTA